jgi:hypothetical protein
MLYSLVYTTNTKRVNTFTFVREHFAETPFLKLSCLSEEVSNSTLEICKLEIEV